MRIAVIDNESHTLFVEDINDEILEGQYGGDEQLYIDDNYSLKDYSWDYIVDTQYIPEGDKTPVEINFEDYCKGKLNIIDILKLNNKNKSLNEKKLNLISLKLGKNNKSKNKRLSPDLNCRLSAHKNNAIKNYNKNINKQKDVNNSCANLNEKKIKYLKIDDGTGEEIRKNNIENNLFSENNLIDIEKIIDDKFDDLYSIIKRLNFSTVLLNNEGLFSVENKVYQNHTQVFNNYFDKFYLKNLSTVKKVNKSSKGKNCSASTKVNTTSCKKNSYQNETYSKENEYSSYKNLSFSCSPLHPQHL